MSTVGEMVTSSHTVICIMAVLIQVSDDRSISRSVIIKTILNHVFKIIDKPHDDIRQAISQYCSPFQTGLKKDTADLTANETGDHQKQNRKTNSKSKSDCGKTKGTKKRHSNMCTIIQWNANGIVAHLPELKVFLSQQATLPDIICVQESLY